jgi:tetratricopeptide (TPR) repeat protein
MFVEKGSETEQRLVSPSTTKPLNLIKLNHFKTKASAHLKDGNYIAAYETYSMCIDMVLESSSSSSSSQKKRNKDETLVLESLYCNRSLTYEKAGKYTLALEDALKCRDTNSKAKWRAAMALKGLNRFPDALDCFRESYRLLPASEQPSYFGEYNKVICNVTKRLTREDLGRYVMKEVNAVCLPPRLETVTKLEQEEAMFRAIREEHSQNRKPGDYYTYVAKWVLKPMSLSMAYIQRSQMFYKANCFKQARLDAAMAIENCKGGVSRKESMKESEKETKKEEKKEEEEEEGKEDEYNMSYKEASIYVKYNDRSLKVEPFAWYLLGKGFQGEPGFSKEDFVPDHNAAGKCFARAQHLDPDNEMYRNAFRAMTSNLDNAEMSAVLNDKHEQYETSEFGIVDYDSNTDGDVYLGHGKVTFECVNAKLMMFTTASRFQLREYISKSANIELKKVLIESVKLVSSSSTKEDENKENKAFSPSSSTSLCVEFQMDFASDHEHAKKYMNAIDKEQKIVLKTLGLGKFSFVGIEFVAAKTLSFKGYGFGRILQEEISAGKEIVVAQRPSKAIDLPYQNYKLTHSDGTPIERVEKHAFGMTEIHYDKGHMGRNKENVWVSLMDDSIRWRQSSSEVKVIVNTVPKDRFTKHHLDVSIKTKSLKITDRDTKEVYVSGELEYHVLPESSSWYHLQGDGEDGFVFLLEKANLKLLSKADDCEHADMWWDRLFSAHCKIAFDDYDKDYSDLPAPIMNTHLAFEHSKQSVSHIEFEETKERDSCQAKDDIRKRERQERLNVLRGGGAYKSWVRLERESPSNDPLRTDKKKPGGGDRDAELFD